MFGEREIEMGERERERSVVGTYLPGTVLQWCRLFKQCQNLPAGHCVKVVQAV